MKSSPYSEEHPSPPERFTQVQHRLWLLAPFWRQLVALARRKGAGDDAEDIATEAILRGAHAPSLDEQAPLRYLQRIVQNLAVDRHREAAYRDRVDWYWLLPREVSLDTKAADHDLAVRALRRLYATAGPRTAQLVLRRVVDEVTWSQLAAEAGMTTSKVQSQVRRAIHSLRPWLHRQTATKADCG